MNVVTRLPNLPGGIWVVLIGVVNAAAVTIPQQFAGLTWVPIVVGVLDVLLLVLKYLQVQAEVREASSQDLPPGAAAAPAPQSATIQPMSRFFWG